MRKTWIALSSLTILVASSAFANATYITSPISSVESLVQTTQDGGVIQGKDNKGATCYVRVLKTTPGSYYYYNFTISNVPLTESNAQNSVEASLWEMEEITRQDSTALQFTETPFDGYTPTSSWNISLNSDGKVNQVTAKVSGFFGKSFSCDF